jgi:hypothetical protein
VLEVLRTAGYSAAGFDYRQYVPEILVATVTGLAGTYLGKRYADHSGPCFPRGLAPVHQRARHTVHAEGNGSSPAPP